MQSSVAQVPVTLLTGFLGAGKTTLVNRLLREQHGERLAVLVNEFGDVSIDGKLVVHSDEEVVELANGCVCCTVRGDLVRAVLGLLDRRGRAILARPFDRLLIETSGLASPGPILQTLLVEERLARETVAAGVITLCNATSIVGELATFREAEEQVGYADLLILNHSDRASAAQLEEAERELHARNAVATVERAVLAEVELKKVLSISRRSSVDAAAGGSRNALEHAHTDAATTVVLKSGVPLELAKLKIWLQFLASKRSHEIWRIKGLLRCRERTETVLVQGVHQFLEIGPGPEQPNLESVLVLIGRNLDAAELQRGWAVCSGA